VTNLFFNLRNMLAFCGLVLVVASLGNKLYNYIATVCVKCLHDCSSLFLLLCSSCLQLGLTIHLNLATITTITVHTLFLLKLKTDSTP
jgi:hypothetical protein